MGLALTSLTFVLCMVPFALLRLTLTIILIDITGMD